MELHTYTSMQLFRLMLVYKTDCMPLVEDKRHEMSYGTNRDQSKLKQLCVAAHLKPNDRHLSRLRNRGRETSYI